MRTSHDVQQDYRKLLQRARRGDASAKKRLREMGLLYWEHRGRVILGRPWIRQPDTVRPTQRIRGRSWRLGDRACSA